MTLHEISAIIIHIIVVPHINIISHKPRNVNKGGCFMLSKHKDINCNLIDISQRLPLSDFEDDFNELVPKVEQSDSELEKYNEYTQKQKDTQGMDALPLDLFDKMLNNCLFRKDFRSAFWLVAMANTGLRHSDVVKFRRADFIDENNKIRDSIIVQEKKTDKQRIVFVNKAMKEALLMLLWNDNLNPMDFLIKSKGNYKGYEMETLIDDNGHKKVMRINGKYVYKLDINGNKIPKPLSRSQSEAIMKKIIINYLGIPIKNSKSCSRDEGNGKYNTHSIRKLYGWAITNDFITQFDSNEAYAHTAALRFLSQDYGHSSEAMTLRYSKDFDGLKREIVLRMNLGLNVLDKYFQEERAKYLTMKGL